MSEQNLMSKVISLCKRRGFIFQSSEIYGGINGCWDFGPLGVELAKNVKDIWWKDIVYKNDNIVGVDASILMNAGVWEASGHTSGFVDPMVDCKVCRRRFKADQIEGIKVEKIVSPKKDKRFKELISWRMKKDVKCPECGGELTEPRSFNMMFRTFIGPVETDATITYLRPETCQGIFVNFQNVLSSFPLVLPFGIAQIGKAFRNEITTGNFIFRVRELEQLELEFFVDPGEVEKWFDYWKMERFNWHLKLGLKKENIRLRRHDDDERAHYAAEAFDVEYKFPFGGFKELEGIANRTDYDLRKHSQFSGKDMSYYDSKQKKRIFPFVIEPSLGLERMVLSLLLDAYHEEKQEKETRVLLKLQPKLSPFKLAVFPLLANRKDLIEKARKIYEDLKPSFRTAWDDIGNIGKRYRRQDEIGTPWCITIDYDTLKNNTVTIRDRDSMEQERVKVGEIEEWVHGKLKN